jgi:hypothetical protein
VPCCYVTDIQILKQKKLYTPNQIKVDIFFIELVNQQNMFSKF